MKIGMNRIWRDLFADPMELCVSGLQFIRKGMA